MPHLKNITIIGVGIIGGSLGMALKRKVHDVKVTGVDNAKTLSEAKALGAIDEGVEKPHMLQCLKRSDLVFLCKLSYA